MIYIVIICAIFLGVLWYSSPTGMIVHAARPRDVIFVNKRFPFSPFYRDIDGNPILMDGKIIGLANGFSAMKHGIPNRSTVLADVLDDNEKAELLGGELVIIESHTPRKASRRRFRKIKSISNGIVSFVNDEKEPFDDRPIDDIYAKVTHVA